MHAVQLLYINISYKSVAACKIIEFYLNYSIMNL